METAPDMPTEILKEKTQHNNENYFKGLIENLPVAVYTCNMEGIITFYNDAAAQLWGHRPKKGKALLCGFMKIYSPDGKPLPAEESPMAIALKEQRAVTGQEIMIEQPDGTRKYIIPHTTPIYAPSGEMTGALSMLTDITEKKKHESIILESEDRYRTLSGSLEKKVDERTLTLRESEERYYKMIDEVQDYAILLLNKDGFIMNWNRGAEKIKGYKESEIIGKNFRIFYLDKDREEKLPEKLITRAMETGRAMHEGWRVRKDGTTFWGYIVITALHDKNNNVIGFSKVTRDLTERKLAEDQLKNSNREIEFRNKQLEEYAYIASHDLQEPLRKIQTFTELLELKIDDREAVKRNLEKINSSARRMSTLIKDVLRYSQLSQTEELLTEIDLNQALKNVLEDFDLLIEQKKATVTIGHLPRINGVPIQIHQLFSNLISNSLKFSSVDPLITITAKQVPGKDFEELNTLHTYVKISFSDNGVGFEPQYVDQVFKMFRRLSSKSGTGIGLALCKKIVENHNGHISVASAPGAGTTFTIYLPLPA